MLPPTAVERATNPKADDGVVDAEFSEVDDNDKKNNA